jgi:hypothetical protein
MASPYNPAGIIAEEFPDQALRAICRAILSAYPRTERLLDNQDWTKEERHDVRPQIRRTNVEAAVRFVAARFPQITVKKFPNKTGNAYHNRIVCGRTVLTVHYVYERYDMPDEAAFRLQLARDPQGSFLGGEDSPPSNGKEMLYGFLLHVPDRPDGTSREVIRHRPAFLNIGFPDKECKTYLGEFMNLYHRYPDLLAVGADREDIVQPKPELRRVDEAQGQ